MIKRDIHLAKLKGVKRRQDLTLRSYAKWLTGYLKEKHARSWYKFLSSLPLKMRIRYILASLFIPCPAILLLSLLLQLPLFIHIVLLSILLTIFLDTLRDYTSSPRKVHKSIVLAFLAYINRSIRCIAVLYYVCTKMFSKIIMRKHRTI